MSHNYDNWEKLVGAVLRREELRALAYCDSFDTIYSISTDGYESSSSRTSSQGTPLLTQPVTVLPEPSSSQGASLLTQKSNLHPVKVLSELPSSRTFFQGATSQTQKKSKLHPMKLARAVFRRKEPREQTYRESMDTIYKTYSYDNNLNDQLLEEGRWPVGPVPIPRASKPRQYDILGELRHHKLEFAIGVLITVLALPLVFFLFSGLLGFLIGFIRCISSFLIGFISCVFGFLIRFICGIFGFLIGFLRSYYNFCFRIGGRWVWKMIN